MTFNVKFSIEGKEFEVKFKAPNEREVRSLLPKAITFTKITPTCEKRKYRTKESAEEAGVKINENNKRLIANGNISLLATGKQITRAYNCGICGHWHITSK